tara:strand:- start:171 stop:356 length:186 start_codon:yes stop_codon:yes gene_type:complete
MDKNILEAMQVIVDQLWRDEFKDWDSKENPHDHLFHAINTLKNHLEGIKRAKENNHDNEVQ